MRSRRLCSLCSSRSCSLLDGAQYRILPGTGLAFTADGCTDAPAGVSPPASMPLPSSMVIWFFPLLLSRACVRGLPLNACYARRWFFSMGCNPTRNYWTCTPIRTRPPGSGRAAGWAGPRRSPACLPSRSGGLIALVLKVLSGFRRNLMIGHLVHGFHPRDASAEVGFFEPFL